MRKRKATCTATAKLLTDVVAGDLRLAFGGGCAPVPPPPAQVRPVLFAKQMAPYWTPTLASLRWGGA